MYSVFPLVVDSISTPTAQLHQRVRWTQPWPQKLRGLPRPSLHRSSSALEGFFMA